MPRRTSPRDPDPTATMSFQDAQTALELVLAQLQSSELAVEQMADLYRRAVSYADRCEQVLAVVEQEVMQWDPQTPDQPPQADTQSSESTGAGQVQPGRPGG